MLYFNLGQWTPNATKVQTSTCRRTPHIQHIRTIEWHYRIPGNVCLAHTSNTQRQVRMKNVVFKHHVVFQKLLFLLEGEHCARLFSYSRQSI